MSVDFSRKLPFFFCFATYIMRAQLRSSIKLLGVRFEYPGLFCCVHLSQYFCGLCLLLFTSNINLSSTIQDLQVKTMPALLVLKAVSAASASVPLIERTWRGKGTYDLARRAQIGALPSFQAAVKSFFRPDFSEKFHECISKAKTYGVDPNPCVADPKVYDSYSSSMRDQLGHLTGWTKNTPPRTNMILRNKLLNKSVKI